jgi:hypothetical protein
MSPASMPSSGRIAAFLVVGTLALLVVRWTMPGADAAPREPNAAYGASAEAAIGAFQVRDLEGRIVPLVTPGEPAIVMVNSISCGWCKRALRDIGELSNGRPVPYLKLLTLEGAAVGVPMLAKEGITGAQLIGPAGQSDQVLLTFRYPGTPTFVAIDRSGRVVRTMPGYPIRQEMEHWFAVMVGDSEVP